MLHHCLVDKFPDPLEIVAVKSLTLLLLDSLDLLGNESPIVKLIAVLLGEFACLDKVLLIPVAEAGHVLVQVRLDREAAFDFLVFTC